jgi:hypothetical protein
VSLSSASTILLNTLKILEAWALKPGVPWELKKFMFEKSNQRQSCSCSKYLSDLIKVQRFDVTESKLTLRSAKGLSLNAVNFCWFSGKRSRKVWNINSAESKVCEWE